MKTEIGSTQKRVVVLDHFDSFTYNVVTAFERVGAAVQVFRTDVSIKEIQASHPTHLVLSPGPGHPRDVVMFEQALLHFREQVPILGVCLGEQAIGLHFGGTVGLAPTPMHGKTSLVFHEGNRIFEGIPSPFTACRYHSLAVSPKGLDPKQLVVTARCKDDAVMAVQGVKYPTVIGVQFHPESLFTEHGEKLLANFLKIKEAKVLRGGVHWEWRWEGWQTKG